MCASVFGSCAYSTEFDYQVNTFVQAIMWKWQWIQPLLHAVPPEKMRASVSGSCVHSAEFDCIKFYLRSSNNVTVTMAPAVTTCCSSSSTTSVVIITSKIGNEARTRITSLYSSSVNFLKRDRRSSSWKQTDIQNYFPMESSQIFFLFQQLENTTIQFFLISAFLNLKAQSPLMTSLWWQKPGKRVIWNPSNEIFICMIRISGQDIFEHI